MVMNMLKAYLSQKLAFGDVALVAAKTDSLLRVGYSDELSEYSKWHTRTPLKILRVFL